MDSLDDYAPETVNVDDAQYVFDVIEAVFAEFGVSAERLSFSVENYFASFYFKVDSQNTVKKALNLTNDVALRLSVAGVRAYGANDGQTFCYEMPIANKSVAGLKSLLASPVKD